MHKLIADSIEAALGIGNCTLGSFFWWSLK